MDTTMLDKINMPTDFEKLRIIVSHLEKVHANMKKIAYHEASKGNIEFARQLMYNAYIHDLSKLENDEFTYLWKDSENFQETLFFHRLSNKHHIEYWEDNTDSECNLNYIPPIYIAEMVCDMVARSMEFGTDIRKYINERFHIGCGLMYIKANEYLNILINEPFKD